MWGSDGVCARRRRELHPGDEERILLGGAIDGGHELSARLTGHLRPIGCTSSRIVRRRDPQEPPCHLQTHGARKKTRLRVDAYPTLNPTGSKRLTHTLPKSHRYGFGEWIRVSTHRYDFSSHSWHRFLPSHLQLTRMHPTTKQPQNPNTV